MEAAQDDEQDRRGHAERDDGEHVRQALRVGDVGAAAAQDPVTEQPVDGFARVVHGVGHAGEVRYLCEGIGHGPTLCGGRRRLDAAPGRPRRGPGTRGERTVPGRPTWEGGMCRSSLRASGAGASGARALDTREHGL